MYRPRSKRGDTHLVTEPFFVHLNPTDEDRSKYPTVDRLSRYWTKPEGSFIPPNDMEVQAKAFRSGILLYITDVDVNDAQACQQAVLRALDEARRLERPQQARYSRLDPFYYRSGIEARQLVYTNSKATELLDDYDQIIEYAREGQLLKYQLKNQLGFHLTRGKPEVASLSMCVHWAKKWMKYRNRFFENSVCNSPMDMYNPEFWTNTVQARRPQVNYEIHSPDLANDILWPWVGSLDQNQFLSSGPASREAVEHVFKMSLSEAVALVTCAMTPEGPNGIDWDTNCFRGAINFINIWCAVRENILGIISGGAVNVPARFHVRTMEHTLFRREVWRREGGLSINQKYVQIVEDVLRLAFWKVANPGNMIDDGDWHHVNRQMEDIKSDVQGWEMLKAPSMVRPVDRNASPFINALSRFRLFSNIPHHAPDVDRTWIPQLAVNRLVDDRSKMGRGFMKGTTNSFIELIDPNRNPSVPYQWPPTY
ncbi:hypothetical protein F5Y15DRAFT_423755 [Xylariaceae sp. FL0016]|nr:hypothetical protein F5Y15DRAFT_423755 [Xylariaceae sp. FL0016]